MEIGSKLFGVALAAAFTTTGAFAQGADDCANADVIGPGPTVVPFDTTNCSDTLTFATTSPTTSTCGTTEDVWFAWTSSAGAVTANFDLCTGTTYDVELAVFDGTCGALNQLACNDDFCGLQSGINGLAVNPGTTYYVEVGYWSVGGGVWGTGNLTITEPGPPVVTQGVGDPTCGILLNFDTPAVATGPIAGNDPAFTSVGIANVALVGSWNAAGDLMTGASNVQGRALVSQNGQLAIADVNQPLDNPGAGGGFDFTLAAPATEFGTLFVDQINWDYEIEIFLGGSSLGTATYSYSGGFPSPAHYWTSTVGPFDRLIVTTVPANGGWGCDNIGFCSAGPGNIGTQYCGAVANSTGSGGDLTAFGSTTASDNNVTLTAGSLPLNQFGYFLNSMTAGFVPNPGGSQGNLCLSGAIGRYAPASGFAPFNTGATGSGSLALDLNNTPTPSGPTAIVAGQTWNFQSWYRDNNPGTTSNFTNGLEIVFN